MKKFIIMVCLMFVVPAYALVIGDWEGTPDGWIDWGNQESIDSATNMPSMYNYDVIGTTLNSESLLVSQAGWAQSLAIKLDGAQRAAFMASDTFSIDMSVAATPGITGGYTQIAELAMNAEGPGWTAVATGNPVNFYWWDGRPDETQTLTVDYSAFRDAITSTGYIEIIFALNTGGGAPPEMYFDNAQLTGVPEPATMLLLGLGGLILRRRK